MRRIPPGGTSMWCPKCKKATQCAAIPLERERSSERIQQKVVKAGNGEIHCFERDRKCTVCGEEFETVEVEKDFLYELVKLRDFVGNIQDETNAMIRLQG
jgi:hypothetical protein